MGVKMLIKAGIKQCVVAEHVFSIRFVTVSNQASLEELKSIKNKQMEFTIFLRGKDKEEENDRISFIGKLKSINLRNKINFVVHTQKDKDLIIRIIKIMENPVTIAFKSDKEKLLMELLQKAKETTSRNIPDIIYELTSFTTKDGKFIKGKTNIYALSDKQKEILTNKLFKLTAQPVENKATL